MPTCQSHTQRRIPPLHLLWSNLCKSMMIGDTQVKPLHYLMLLEKPPLLLLRLSLAAAGRTCLWIPFGLHRQRLTTWNRDGTRKGRQGGLRRRTSRGGNRMLSRGSSRRRSWRGSKRMSRGGFMRSRGRPKKWRRGGFVSSSREGCKRWSRGGRRGRLPNISLLKGRLLRLRTLISRSSRISKMFQTLRM